MNSFQHLPDLAQAIKTRRNGRSLREMGKMVGVSAATLSRAENGQEISLESFRRIEAWLRPDDSRMAALRESAVAYVDAKRNYNAAHDKWQAIKPLPVPWSDLDQARQELGFAERQALAALREFFGLSFKNGEKTT